MSTAHRIRRHCWQVRTPRQEQAFALRTQLHGAWAAVAPVFEQHFDRIAPDRIIRIPQLRLELRISDSAELEAIAPMLIDEQLRSALEPWLAAAPAADHTRPAGTTFTDLQILERYLESGELHWSLLGSDVAPQERIVLLRATLVQAFAPALAAARRAPAQAGLFRLLQLLANTTAPELAELLRPHASADTCALVAELLTGEHAAILPAYTRVQLAAALLAVADTSGTAQRAQAAALQPLLADLHPPAAAIFDQMLKSAAPLLHDVLALSGPSSTQLSATLLAGDTSNNTQTAVDDPSFQSHEPEVDEPDRVVMHAGLVLLHPYIARLFQQCDLTVDQELPATNRARAAALLHFIATGLTDVHEFELPLIKLLLGIEPDEPLPVASGLLRDVDMAEADALLPAVIEHWPVLRRTSIATLRTEFLQRSGLLARSDFGWRLRVQPAAFDALLNHLPWPISIIRLPWQPHTLEVEWPTP